MLTKANFIYLGLAKPSSDDGVPSGGGDITRDEFITLSEEVAANTDDINDIIDGNYNKNVGLRGDYCSKYGIINSPYGLIDYSISDKDIVVKAGIQLFMWGDDLKTQIASDTPYEVTANRDVTLFLVDGDVLECDVFWQYSEPDNGGDAFLAWWNGEKWQFKSNATGNVWRTPGKATPIADLHINNGIINRIDYAGYRLLNEQDFAPKDSFNQLVEDEARLGDQVAVIESKIPSVASANNPLVAQSQMPNDSRLLSGAKVSLADSQAVDIEELVYDYNLLLEHLRNRGIFE